MAHTPRKRFGQHFLNDPAIIGHIVACAQAACGQHWLEIGPGLGAITRPLLAAGVRLDAVELDRDLAAHLRQTLGGHPNLALHNADALSFDFSSLPGTAHKLRVIGNLPYNISTPLLFHLLDHAASIDHMLLMLQKEVVGRLCAGPGGKDYGRLTVMAAYHCACEWLFDVPPTSFDPPPKVVSAVARLTPHRRPPVAVNAVANLARVVGDAFSQRRKTLRNSLKHLVSAQQISAAGIDPGARAETLTLAEFARLSDLL